ncbi:TatD family hydrolase [Candidatus Micrarchaeota archaeon]|nr:TatD family hydrolase [Candidatus Micrarchaeota archaeon]MBU1939392.1 TatD family hydrolase [Candidatus Micrarchaeota archaeon]
MLIDSHCHLDWFRQPEKVLARAKEKNVRAVISCATNPEAITKNLALAEKLEGVFVCLGLHPSDLLRMDEKQVEEGIASVQKNCSAQGVVGIGEVGLDYKHAETPAQKEKQKEIFSRFIGIAKEKNLPLIVHSRFAEKETMELLRKERAEDVVMHWFTNSAQSVKMAEDFGFFYTAGPAVMHYKKAAEVAAGMKLENLMLETDSPVEFAGKKSEPAWIPEVAEKIAELQGVDVKEVAEKTGANCARVFKGI